MHATTKLHEGIEDLKWAVGHGLLGTQVTSFTSTKVQILTPRAALSGAN